MSCRFMWFSILSMLLPATLLSAAPSEAEPPRLDLLAIPTVDPSLVKMRAVTHGPKFHWFGYYNKYQIDSSGRYLLTMEANFEHRSPKPEDTVKIGMVDLADGDRWIELGESRAWSWQQGCMLQWRPGSESEILYNDREGDKFVCRILDANTRKLRTLPLAIEHVTADGKRAVCADFRRIADTRPGYGYAGVPDPYRKVMAPDEIGVWSMDLDTRAPSASKCCICSICPPVESWFWESFPLPRNTLANGVATCTRASLATASS